MFSHRVVVSRQLVGYEHYDRLISNESLGRNSQSTIYDYDSGTIFEDRTYCGPVKYENRSLRQVPRSRL